MIRAELQNNIEVPCVVRALSQLPGHSCSVVILPAHQTCLCLLFSSGLVQWGGTAEKSEGVWRPCQHPPFDLFLYQTSSFRNIKIVTADLFYSPCLSWSHHMYPVFIFHTTCSLFPLPPVIYGSHTLRLQLRGGFLSAWGTFQLFCPVLDAVCPSFSISWRRAMHMWLIKDGWVLLTCFSVSLMLYVLLFSAAMHICVDMGPVNIIFKESFVCPVWVKEKDTHCALTLNSWTPSTCWCRSSAHCTSFLWNLPSWSTTANNTLFRHNFGVSVLELVAQVLQV